MNGHPTREEDFDLYALGALEGDEKSALENHLAACADCAGKLAEAQGRIALLAFAAPRVEPSAGVKQRLMQQVRADAAAGAAVPASRTRDEAAREPQDTGGFFGRWWAAVLVPATAILAVVAIFLWNQNSRLNQQLAQMRSDAQSQNQQVQQQLQEARAVAGFMSASDTIVVALAQQPRMPTGSAHVMYNAKMGMLMFDGQIAPPAAGKSYQLWMVPATGNPISAGVFTPANGNMNHWIMKLPPGIIPKAFAVTIEPAGGMPQPTGPKVLVGAVS